MDWRREGSPFVVLQGEDVREQSVDSTASAAAGGSEAGRLGGGKVASEGPRLGVLIVKVLGRVGMEVVVIVFSRLKPLLSFIWLSRMSLFFSYLDSSPELAVKIVKPAAAVSSILVVVVIAVVVASVPASPSPESVVEAEVIAAAASMVVSSMMIILVPLETQIFGDCIVYGFGVAK